MSCYVLVLFSFPATNLNSHIMISMNVMCHCKCNPVVPVVALESQHLMTSVNIALKVTHLDLRAGRED
jgi:hypothetical protein